VPVPQGKPRLSSALGENGAKLAGAPDPQTTTLNFHFLSFSFSLRCHIFSYRKITFLSLLKLRLNLRKFQLAGSDVSSKFCPKLEEERKKPWDSEKLGICHV